MAPATVQDLQRKNELLAGAVDTSSPELHAQQVEGMNNHELMEYGRGKMKATNESIEVRDPATAVALPIGDEQTRRNAHQNSNTQP